MPARTRVRLTAPAGLRACPPRAEPTYFTEAGFLVAHQIKEDEGGGEGGEGEEGGGGMVFEAQDSAIVCFMSRLDDEVPSH